MADASSPSRSAQLDGHSTVGCGSAARARARSQRAWGRRLDAMRCIGRAEGSHHSMGISEKVHVVEERLMLYVEEVVSLRIELAMNERFALMESSLLASLQGQLGVSQQPTCEEVQCENEFYTAPVADAAAQTEPRCCDLPASPLVVDASAQAGVTRGDADADGFVGVARCNTKKRELRVQISDASTAASCSDGSNIDPAGLHKLPEQLPLALPRLTTSEITAEDSASEGSEDDDDETCSDEPAPLLCCPEGIVALLEGMIAEQGGQMPRSALADAVVDGDVDEEALKLFLVSQRCKEAFVFKKSGLMLTRSTSFNTSSSRG